jgi:ABC-type sugar transport system permease subunit
MHTTPSTKRLWLPSLLFLFLLPVLLIVVFFIVPIGITGVISLTSLDYRAEFVVHTSSSGVVVIPQKLPVRAAVEDLLLIWTASEAEEWINRMQVLPL